MSAPLGIKGLKHAPLIMPDICGDANTLTADPATHVIREIYMSVQGLIEKGLRYAQADYVSIAERERFDVKPKEDQIKCALYRSFCEAGYLVHVEASYQRNRGRCDLYAVCGTSKTRVAIEIKTAWAGNGWTNKPGEQQSAWEADIQKIKGAEGTQWADSGYFILCFAYERGSAHEHRLRERMLGLGGQCMPAFALADWNGLNEAQFCLVNVFGD
ncbi:hypothetical protein [Pseudomonas sp. NUPR-001]|uniref:hypothetical protein n=1 Tax=Pseudomonas sp. NUPR-001 TaxID=3416058 RepID=UPI003F94685F